MFKSCSRDQRDITNTELRFLEFRLKFQSNYKKILNHNDNF